MVNIQQMIAALLSIIALLTPLFRFTPIEEDKLLLNVSVISDTHIDASLPLGQSLLASALEDMSRSEVGTDALVVSGDLTNYGDTESVDAFYSILNKHASSDKWVLAMGNHDVGHVEDRTHDEARQYLIDSYNKNTGSAIEHIYYSVDVNGYTFICLGDQSDDNWDRFDIYDDQLEFLDTELARAAVDGKPAFVVCHLPVEGVNGQPIVWEDGCLRTEYSDAVKAVIEKYENVVYISGHMHEGINSELTSELLGFSCVEKHNGVTYINLPTYLLVNRYGIPWGGMGFQLELYDGRLEVRARNFATGKWYPDYAYTVELD